MQRAIRTLLVAVVVLPLLISSGVGWSRTEPADTPSQPLLIVVPVDYEQQIRGAEILAESLRSFGGRLRDLPIRVYAPAQLGPALAQRSERLSILGVGTRTVEVPPIASHYVLGAKPFLAAAAEREAGDVRLVAVMAPNTIVLSAPEALLLPATAQLGYSTVHHQNVGSLASEPPDEMWKRIYAVLGVREESVFTNRTLADDRLVRFYFNAGSFVVRPEHGLLQAWARAFEKLTADREIARLCAEGPRNVFLHQAALAAAALRSLGEAEVVRLPDTYSYPLFFKRFHGGTLDFASLEGVVTLRYEFRADDLPEGWEQEVQAPPGVVAWIKERLTADAP